MPYETTNPTGYCTHQKDLSLRPAICFASQVVQTVKISVRVKCKSNQTGCCLRFNACLVPYTRSGAKLKLQNGIIMNWRLKDCQVIRDKTTHMHGLHEGKICITIHVCKHDATTFDNLVYAIQTSVSIRRQSTRCTRSTYISTGTTRRCLLNLYRSSKGKWWLL